LGRPVPGPRQEVAWLDGARIFCSSVTLRDRRSDEKRAGGLYAMGPWWLACACCNFQPKAITGFDD
jgi:hypothetical protein